MDTSPDALSVRVVRGHTTDPTALHRHWTRWERAVASSIDGYLGATAGVGDDGAFIAVIRFAGAAAARRSAGEPATAALWGDVVGLLRGCIVEDTERTDTWNRGGSDDAGFVQIRHGRSSDPERLRDLYVNQQPVRMGPYRPEVLGGLFAWHGHGRFTLSAYFSSEDAARAGENLQEFRSFFDDIDAVMHDLTYVDLHRPWLSSRPEQRDAYLSTPSA